MDYASSYAVGGPQLGDQGGGRHHAVHAPATVLPAPRPERMHWSTIVFTIGMAICAIGLLVTISGAPAKLGYDLDAPGERTKPDSNDPLTVSRTLDANMKWIAEHSSDAPGNYVGYIKSINRSEAAIPAMMQALVSMDASVKSIDAGLGGLGDVTTAMGDDLQSMADVSGTSGATMTALGTDIGFLSSSMVELATATEELTVRMSSIERKAGGIAENGTSAALDNTKALNQSLPDEVPVPLTTDGEPLDVAMKRLQASGGGGAVDSGAVAQ